jgi:DNA-binding CsgD family transcriptional regulator
MGCMAKDYKLELKIKNGYLSMMMSENGIKTAAELSRLSGASQQDIGAMLALQYTPIAKDGQLKSGASKLCEYFGCAVDAIFPMDHMYLPLEQNKFEGYVNLEEMQRIASCPSELIAIDDARSVVHMALDKLTEREQRVLTMLFGMGDQRKLTLEEAGKQLDVTRERIRQIEAKALRKLRHPSLATALRVEFES